MYRNCIYCAGDLGSNPAVASFPVGRSVAFDGVKGRLWAVCPRCARWNLAPLEERWEAIEEAERAFRDTRTRVQNENVGVAKLPDGTRLVRVGHALRGELAAWRYGNLLVRRYRRQAFVSGLTSAAVLTVGPLAVLVPAASWLADVARYGWRRRPTNPDQYVPASLSPTGRALVLPIGAVQDAYLDTGTAGEVVLRVPLFGGRGTGRMFVPFADDAARTVMSRAMLLINRDGASPADVRHALRTLTDAPSAEAFIRDVARNRGRLGGRKVEGTRNLSPTGLQALEMALHEEQERRVLEGELAGLEAMWRQAEEIAAIADALPDAVPATEPPRLVIG